MVFENRRHAGQLLAKELKKRKIPHKNVIVAGITRGGVVVASEIAKILKAPLTAIVVKKLGAPTNPELAIGAVGSWGLPVVDRWLVGDLALSKEWLRREVRDKKKEAKRLETYLGIADSGFFEGNTVVIVDDGLATGQTVRAALKMARELNARKVILAVPVGAPSVVAMVSEDFDEVVCLVVDPNLEAVGQYYRDFRPVDDSEVKAILDGQLTSDH